MLRRISQPISKKIIKKRRKIYKTCHFVSHSAAFFITILLYLELYCPYPLMQTVLLPPVHQMSPAFCDRLRSGKGHWLQYALLPAPDHGHLLCLRTV